MVEEKDSSKTPKEKALNVIIKHSKDAISSNWKTFLASNPPNPNKPTKRKNDEHDKPFRKREKFIRRKPNVSDNDQSEKVEEVILDVKVNKRNGKVNNQDGEHQKSRKTNGNADNVEEKKSLESADVEISDDDEIERVRGDECVNFFTSKKSTNKMPLIPGAGPRDDDGRYAKIFWSSYLTVSTKNKYKVISYPVKDIVSTDRQYLNRPDAIGSKGTRPKLSLDRPFVGLDCEMVGVGPNGTASILARVSLVNDKMECIYDTFVKPIAHVTDYRTKYSGVTKPDMKTGADFRVVQRIVATLIYNRILVGHALVNDLDVLGLKYPSKYIRDTAKYRPLKNPKKPRNPQKLKLLTKKILKEDIQGGEHDSIVDARSALGVYLKMQEEWETGKREAEVVVE